MCPQVIWLEAIKEQLSIPMNDLPQYRAVLVIPTLYRCFKLCCTLLSFFFFYDLRYSVFDQKSIFQTVSNLGGVA